MIMALCSGIFFRTIGMSFRLWGQKVLGLGVAASLPTTVWVWG